MNTKAKQGGLGIVSILTIVFIVLKLSGVIKWHWIWVLSPIWISALTAVILFAGILIGGSAAGGGSQWREAFILTIDCRCPFCYLSGAAPSRVPFFARFFWLLT